VVTNNPLNAFGFLLQQEGVTQQAFDPSRLNIPGGPQHRDHGRARVPPLNLDLLYARKGARLQQEVRGHQLAYTRQHIAFATRKAYTQLQFAYALRHILSTTLDDVKQIHRSVSNFRDQGLVQQSDVLNAQVQVNTVESALAKAQSNIANASEALAMLMGQGTGQQTIFTVDSLSQVPPMPSGSELPASRPDLMARRQPSPPRRPWRSRPSWP
jgi:outer membrane protein TolC